MDLLENAFFIAIICFGSNALNVNTLKHVSMNNQERRIRPKIINLNNSETSFYLYIIKVNKCKGSYNKTNYTYAKLCFWCS